MRYTFLGKNCHKKRLQPSILIDYLHLCLRRRKYLLTFLHLLRFPVFSLILRPYLQRYKNIRTICIFLSYFFSRSHSPQYVFKLFQLFLGNCELTLQQWLKHGTLWRESNNCNNVYLPYKSNQTVSAYMCLLISDFVHCFSLSASPICHTKTIMNCRSCDVYMKIQLQDQRSLVQTLLVILS